MSEREPWRPDAEPWEALLEADVRVGTASSSYAVEALWKKKAEALLGMGWALIPRTALNRLENEADAAWRSSSKASQRCGELEAEVERLRGLVARAADNCHAVGMAGTGSMLRRRLGESSPPASVPVPEEPEGDEVTGDAIAHLATLVRWVLDEADWSGGNERFVEPLEDALGEFRDADADGSLAPEEPEGEKALRFLRELRQYLDRRLRKYGDGDLSDYEVGCKQELEGVSTWLAEFEAQPAPVPVPESAARASLVARAHILRNLAAEVRRELVPEEPSSLNLAGSLGEAIMDATGVGVLEFAGVDEVAEGIARWIETQADPSPVPEEPEGERFSNPDDGEMTWAELISVPAESFSDFFTDAAMAGREVVESLVKRDWNWDRDGDVAVAGIGAAMLAHIASVLDDPAIAKGLAEEEHPAPVPVEEPEEPAFDEVPAEDCYSIYAGSSGCAQAVPVPAPEIKVGQVWRDGRGLLWQVEVLRNGSGVTMRSESGNVVTDLAADGVVSAWTLAFEAHPPAPSLNPEGLAWLDREIERVRADMDETSRQKDYGLSVRLGDRLGALLDVRSRLVSTPSEEQTDA